MHGNARMLQSPVAYLTRLSSRPISLSLVLPHYLEFFQNERRTTR